MTVAKPAHVLWTPRSRAGLPVVTDAAFAMPASSGTWVQDLPGITRPPRGRPRV
jgi:hypothetical protein